MKNIKLILIVVVVAILAAAAAGGVVWWKLGQNHNQAHDVDAGKSKPAKSDVEYKYVTLDKVLVMLQGSGQGATQHYIVVDLVFKSTHEDDKRIKEHLPLLRTIAVKALSPLTSETARALTVIQLADRLNKAFKDSYAVEQQEPPFVEALIAKLIIE
jgi:flagellar FliL protein